jgi:hypothetical protein
MNRRSFLKQSGVVSAAAMASKLAVAAPNVSIIVDPSDPVAAAAPPAWAVRELQAVVARQGGRRMFSKGGCGPPPAAVMAHDARAVYVSDVTYGPNANLRGHWLDRLPESTGISATWKSVWAKPRPQRRAPEIRQLPGVPSPRPSLGHSVCRCPASTHPC